MTRPVQGGWWMAWVHISASSGLTPALPGSSWLGHLGMKATAGWEKGCMWQHFWAIRQLAVVSMESVVAHLAASLAPAMTLVWGYCICHGQTKGRVQKVFLSDSPGFWCCCFSGGSDFSSGSAEVTHTASPVQWFLCHVWISLKTWLFSSLCHEL